MCRNMELRFLCRQDEAPLSTAQGEAPGREVAMSYMSEDTCVDPLAGGHQFS